MMSNDYICITPFKLPIHPCLVKNEISQQSMSNSNVFHRCDFISNSYLHENSDSPQTKNEEWKSKYFQTDNRRNEQFQYPYCHTNNFSRTHNMNQSSFSFNFDQIFERNKENCVKPQFTKTSNNTDNFSFKPLQSLASSSSFINNLTLTTNNSCSNSNYEQYEKSRPKIDLTQFAIKPKNKIKPYANRKTRNYYCLKSSKKNSKFNNKAKINPKTYVHMNGSTITSSKQTPSNICTSILEYNGIDDTKKCETNNTNNVAVNAMKTSKNLTPNDFNENNVRDTINYSNFNSERTSGISFETNKSEVSSEKQTIRWQSTQVHITSITNTSNTLDIDSNSISITNNMQDLQPSAEHGDSEEWFKEIPDSILKVVDTGMVENNATIKTVSSIENQEMRKEEIVTNKEEYQTGTNKSNTSKTSNHNTLGIEHVKEPQSNMKQIKFINFGLPSQDSQLFIEDDQAPINVESVNKTMKNKKISDFFPIVKCKSIDCKKINLKTVNNCYEKTSNANL